MADGDFRHEERRERVSWCSVCETDLIARFVSGPIVRHWRAQTAWFCVAYKETSVVVQGKPLPSREWGICCSTECVDKIAADDEWVRGKTTDVFPKLQFPLYRIEEHPSGLLFGTFWRDAP